MYKVMIVDDEPIIVEGLSRSIAWEKWNCKVAATAHDGLEGKKIIEEIHPDIVFMDICMPEMDGLAMIAAIHSQFPDLEVCVLTGYRDFEYAKEAIRLGVTRFLLKPSNMDELEEAIGKMCGNLKRKGITGDEPKRDPQDEEAAEAHKESASSSFIVKNALTYIEERRRKLHRQQCGLVHAGAFPGKDHPSGGGREDLCEPVAFKQAFKPPHGAELFGYFKSRPYRACERTAKRSVAAHRRYLRAGGIFRSGTFFEGI